MVVTRLLIVMSGRMELIIPSFMWRLHEKRESLLLHSAPPLPFRIWSASFWIPSLFLVCLVFAWCSFSEFLIYSRWAQEEPSGDQWENGGLPLCKPEPARVSEVFLRPPPRPAASALFCMRASRGSALPPFVWAPSLCSLPGNMLVPPTSETTFSSPRVMCVLTQKDDKMTPGSIVFSSMAFLRLVVCVLQTVYLQLMPDYFSSGRSVLFPKTGPFSFRMKGGCDACLRGWMEGEFWNEWYFPQLLGNGSGSARFVLPPATNSLTNGDLC